MRTSSSNFDLTGNDAETLMRWDAEVGLSGLLGRLAGSSLEAVAERQAKRMLDAVELALTRLPAEAADGADQADCSPQRARHATELASTRSVGREP